ncbi:hypothetical protein DM01DRAFT_1348540 [Hesseltinella vesiculosa]|uniref:Uncharacterized protein n=1 Tax=Hesseltinella vesiculosa TaxID=101127 RepID=A0A1X2G8S0_9FUNG|nr:hypothetical protein DM01DRAFT_1348540 [Hesseltinella vesiculosa]
MSKKRSRGALNERQQAGFDRRMSNLQEKMDFYKKERKQIISSKHSSSVEAQSSTDVSIATDADAAALSDDLDSDGRNVEDHEEPSEADVSARRMRSLQGITMKLLFSESDVTLQDTSLKKHTQKLQLIDKEVRAMKLVFNTLKPYIPCENAPKCHRLNIILFGNEVLRVVGYDKFTMEACPSVSAGTTYSLSLDAPSVHELLGKHINVKEKGIGSAAQARHQKNDVFACLFNMDKVEQICSKNGIQFIHHIDIHGSGDVALRGTTMKPRQKSVYEERKLRGMGKTAPGSVPVQESIDELDLCIKNLEKERDVQSKSARIATASLSDLGKNMKDKLTRGYGDERFKQERHDDVKAERILKEQKREAIKAKHDILDKLAEKRKMKYLHQKRQICREKTCEGHGQQPPPPPTVLTPTTRTEEDPCETEIGTVDLEHTVVSGTDYGIVSFATTVTHSAQQLSTIMKGEFVKLPKATTTTAKDLHWRTGTFHFMKKLQKRKKAARISDSEALLAKNAMTFCTTHDDLLARYAKTQEASAAVQAFYAAPWIGRARRFLDWHTPLVREGMVIQEQRRHKPNQLIRAIGNCGSGVGSRIGGHMRVGGKWHRRVAQRHGVSLIVNEHRTSMTCPFCGSCIMHPKKKGGRLNLGTSACINGSCPSVKISMNTFGRDSLAATCIALRGFGQLVGHPTL